MHFSHNAIVSSLLLLAHTAVAKSGVELDMDDVPSPCKTICRPIGTLSKQCDVDLDSNSSHDERLLQNQCICTNNSFNVGNIAALCADCMHQSVKKRDLSEKRDKHADADDVKGIDKLLATCGFASTHYDPSVTSSVASITVDASRPTNINQLTITLDSSRSAGPLPTGSALQQQNAASTSSSKGGAIPTAAANMMYVGGIAAAAAAVGGLL